MVSFLFLFSSESNLKQKRQCFWFSNGLSADTVTNKYRAHYVQLVIVMLKLSHYDEISFGECLCLSYKNVIAATQQSPIDDNVISINLLLCLSKAGLKT